MAYYRGPPPIPRDPVNYPALCAPQYAVVMDPDTTMGRFWGRGEHLRLAVVNGDVAAVHEFSKLRPDLLTKEFFEDTEYRQGGQILGEAVRGNKPAVLNVLLDYREKAFNKAGLSPSITPLPGTPFVSACRSVAVDTLTYLLEERPDRVDVSHHIKKVEDRYGLTPLLTVAAGAHDNARYSPHALDNGAYPSPGMATRLGLVEASKRYVEMLRLLLKHGADANAVRDRLCDSQSFPKYPADAYPGGHGNALVLALQRSGAPDTGPFSDSMMDVINILLEKETGIDIHRGAILPTARVDG